MCSPEDYDLIRKIPINSNLKDSFIWHYDRTGKFTFKSGYKLYMNSKINAASSSSNIMKKVWEKLWKLCIPSKIKHFSWKALNEILPTNINLKKRGMDIPQICHICMSANESTDHILFDCHRATEIWRNLCNKVPG